MTQKKAKEKIKESIRTIINAARELAEAERTYLKAEPRRSQGRK